MQNPNHWTAREFLLRYYFDGGGGAVLGLHCCTGSFLILASGDYSLVAFERASHCSGFSCCGARSLEHTGFNVVAYGLSSCNSPGSREEAQYLWHTGLVAPQHVGSSQTRDRTRVS